MEAMDLDLCNCDGKKKRERERKRSKKWRIGGVTVARYRSAGRSRRVG